MKIKEYARLGKARLEKAGLQCADPLLHMKQILEYALDLDAAGVYRLWEDELSSVIRERADAVLTRRLKGEPFQYIVGYEWFWDCKFRVGPGVLIPRRETEHLVEELLAISETVPQRIAELGGGAGNIGISILRERPDWEWHAFEKNPDSLPYLRENAAALLPAGAKYHIHPGDFFSLAPAFAPYDWLVTNPPYLSTEDLSKIPIEVSHEPRLALAGGGEGSEIIGRLIAGCSTLLKPGGRFLCEIGMAQSGQIERLCETNDLILIKIRPDYAGIPRVVQGKTKS